MKIRRTWRPIAAGLTALFALYLISGFLVVPPILKSQLQKRLQDITNRPVAVGAVRFNPLVLSLTLQDLHIKGKKGEDFVGWKELFINFQASSLLKFSWTFDEIRLVKPVIYIERLTPDAFNFSDLIPASDESNKPEKLEKQDADIVPIIIGKLILNEGTFQFRDSSRETPADFRLASVSFELSAFSTRLKAGESNTYELKARGPRGGSFHWNGTFQLTPFESKGSIGLNGVHLPSLITFYQDELQFSVPEGQFSFSTKYNLFDDPEWGVELEGGTYTLTKLTVLEKKSEKTLLVLPFVNVEGMRLSTTEKNLFVGAAAIKRGEFNASLNDLGEPNIARAMDFSAFDSPPVKGKTPVQQGVESAPAAGDESIKNNHGENWYWEISQFTLEGFAVNFSDNSVKEPVNLTINPLRVQVEDLTGDGHRPLNFFLSATINEKSALEITGNGTIQPVSLALDIDGRNLPLRDFQPYVSQVANLRILDGSPHASIHLQLALNDKGDLSTFHITGNGSLDNLSIQDTLVQSRLLQWQRLGIDTFTLDPLAGKLNISRVTLIEPFVKIQINKNKTTNIQNLMVRAAPDQPEPEAQESEKEQFRVDIEEIVINNGAASFADYSLTPDFVSEILQLNGRIVGASSIPGRTSEVKLEGKVDRHAPVTIQGNSNLLADPPQLDLNLTFNRVDLASLTPYSSTYAGYKIKKGQLSVDLRYVLENNLLHGENNIVMHKLELGEKVKSEQAADLPLKLAIALLKDKDGVIDLDLVVDGDVNDPEFSVAGVFWKVLKNVIMKGATSPFKMLAGIAGGGEDLDTVGFAAGSAVLEEGERGKMMRLAKALDARPQLSVNVRGQVSYISDLQSLKQQHLDRKIETLSGVDPVSLREGDEKMEKRWRDTLFDVYKQSNGQSWKKVRSRLSEEAKRQGENPDKDTLQKQTVTFINEDLVARQIVTDEDLYNLANTRAQTVKAAFVEQFGIAAGRVFVLTPEINQADNSSQALLTLDAL